MNNNNTITLVGKIGNKEEFAYVFNGENFFSCNIIVERLNDTKDILPLILSETVIPREPIIGKQVRIFGDIRTYNQKEDYHTKLVVYVFVYELEVLDDESYYRNLDETILNGFICKDPIYRKTPNGREIADFILAVNRNYGKSDYIPCICWGRNARYMKNMIPGDNIELSGRFQSREYYKNDKKQLAYEVSAQTIKHVVA